jgi:anion-transporting  ArsA/GET3 family ATPase
LIVVTGKGGTGKTVLAAALARLAVSAGKRVLACEVGRDMTSPSPLLGLLAPEAKAANEPQRIGERLAHLVLRGDDGVREFLRDALPFKFMADRALKVDAVRRFLDAAPAFAEMGVLYRGMRLIDQTRKDGAPEYDVMILDAPASGHTLAFASLPDTILKVFTGGPIATAARAGIALLRDPSKTTCVAATLPEALPVSEVTELCVGLRQRGVHIGAVVANQVPHDPFTEEERAALASHLPHEVLGRRALVRIDKAAEALARLRELGAPIFQVFSHAASGQALVGLAERGLVEGAA